MAVVVEKAASILVRLLLPDSPCWHVEAMHGLVIRFVALQSTTQSNTCQNVVLHAKRC